MEPALTPEALLHDLQVHQIELQMQNDELIRVQLTLEDSRQRFEDLYEFAPVGYLTLNERGLIQDANLTSATLLGADRKMILGKQFERFVAPEGQGNWRTYFSSALCQGKKLTYELRLQQSDGTVFDGHLDIQLRTAPDAVRTLRIALTDITERRQAEDALRRSYMLNTAILDAASPEIAVLDSAGVIIAVNQAWQRFAIENSPEPGKPAPFTEVGTDYLAVCHDTPDDDTVVSARTGIAAVLAGNCAEFTLDYPCDSPTKKRWFHMSVTPLPLEQGGAVIIHTDISERNRLEAEMHERRSAMERLVRQQVAAQTAAAIAHELNQPLVSVSAYSEAALAMLRAGKQQPEKLERAITGAAEQAQRAGRTLHELLGFLYKGEVPSIPVDFNEVVQEAISITREENLVSFRSFVDLEPGLPLVMANRIQLEKVILNLLRNSLEAMGNAGVPTPAITITLGSSTTGQMAQVSVQDNGPGLDSETARRIFDPFFTTKADGIGLGLAICRTLIEGHGGELWVETGSAPGATFRFTLPFAT
jgi:two-component system sensor kinase FixL